MTGFLQDTRLAAVLDSIWGSGTPATFYVALFTTAPGTDGTGGVEAAYTGYSRFSVTNNATEFPAAAGSPPVKSNANDWDFGVAGSGPTNVVAVGFYDDPTSTLASHLWAVVDLTGSPVTINSGADVKILASTLDLTGC